MSTSHPLSSLFRSKALNTLMGREVYTSNEQLGGAGVMGPNGISHQLVDSHIGAVASALRWLSYVPSSRGSDLPVVSEKSYFFRRNDALFYAPFFGIVSQLLLRIFLAPTWSD